MIQTQLLWSVQSEIRFFQQSPKINSVNFTIVCWEQKEKSAWSAKCYAENVLHHLSIIGCILRSWRKRAHGSNDLMTLEENKNCSHVKLQFQPQNTNNVRILTLLYSLFFTFRYPFIQKFINITYRNLMSLNFLLYLNFSFKQYY